MKNIIDKIKNIDLDKVIEAAMILPILLVAIATCVFIAFIVAMDIMRWL